MMKLLAVALCISLFPTAVSSDLLIKNAYYRDTNASLHLFIVNRGTEPVTLLPPIVDNVDTASLGRKGLNPGPVLWYRCRPNPIQPGDIADLIVILAQPAAKPVSVEIRTKTGEQIKRTIQCMPEPFRFQAIRFSRDLRSADLYLRWSDASSSDAIKTISMDGKSITNHSSALPAKSIDGLTYARISLDKPLSQGSFHIFEAITTSGLSTAYQIRAIPAEFIIGVYGALSEEQVRDYAAHGCNHHLSFRAISHEQAELLNANGMSAGARIFSDSELVDRKAGAVIECDEKAARLALQDWLSKPGLLYHHLTDEPDVSDYYAGRRLGASSMELIAREQLCDECDPSRYTFVQIDNTFRPLNYAVYGESADVLATHRYSLGSFIRSEAGASSATRLPFMEDLQDTVTRFRCANEPKPFFMVPQFFNLGEKRHGRPPTIEEMRLQCYATIAGGARGLIYYIHSGSTGGGEGGRTPALWDAMTAMHKELKRVGQVTENGTPAPASWVKAGSPNVYAGALLCGESMAVIIINRAHRSELERFTARPTQNVTISLRIPPWIDASKVEIIPADGSTPVPGMLRNGELSFAVNEVKDARCFLICPKVQMP